MIELCCIAPVVASRSFDRIAYQAYLDQQFVDWQGARVTGALLQHGPTSVENERDEAMCIPGVVQAGKAAEHCGASGILIDCMLDPGLHTLRHEVRIPVLGAAECTFRHAAGMGRRFGVVDIGDDTGPLVDNQIRTMGLSDKFSGVRGTGLSPLEVDDDARLSLSKLLSAATSAIVEDGADVIVLGCTAFSRQAGALRQALRARNLVVPVLNPTAFSLGVLVALIRSGGDS